MFMGFTNLLNDLVAHFFTSDKDDYKRMIEIGAYMGESTFLFGCSGIFKDVMNNNYEITDFYMNKVEKIIEDHPLYNEIRKIFNGREV